MKLLASGLIHGLQRADVDYLTLGEWMDVIVEYNNILNPPKAKKENVRKATQADFDKF